MEHLQLKKYAPVITLSVCLIVICLVLIGALQKVHTDNQYLQAELDKAKTVISEHESSLETLTSNLDSTKQDVEKYDEIYESKQSELENVTETLLTEKEQLEKELELEKQEVCIYPYRSVPNAEAFGAAWRMELMIEQLTKLEDMQREGINADEVQIVVGYLYVISTEFKELYIENGVQIGLNEPMNELYKLSNEHLDEIELMYYNFEQYNRNKAKTRVFQLTKLQLNIIKGMQGYYFL